MTSPTEELDELHILKTRLADARSFNEKLVGVVGHELRNALGTIFMTANVLEGKPSDEMVKRSATRLKNSGNRVLSLVTDMNDLCHAELGDGLPIHRTPADLLPLAQEVVDDVTRKHPSHVITFYFHGDLQGAFDAARVEQALRALASSALQHSAKGETVAITAEGETDAVTFTVHVAAPLPDEMLANYFEPFRAGAKPTKRTAAFGLSLVLHIARGHGGDADVHSSPDAGTTFKLVLSRRPTARRAQ